MCWSFPSNIHLNSSFSLICASHLQWRHIKTKAGFISFWKCSWHCFYQVPWQLPCCCYWPVKQPISSPPVTTPPQRTWQDIPISLPNTSLTWRISSSQSTMTFVEEERSLLHTEWPFGNIFRRCLGEPQMKFLEKLGILSQPGRPPPLTERWDTQN